MSIVKVSVANVDGTESKLHELDLNKSLEDNIQDICRLFDKPYSITTYGLKIISTNDGKSLHCYISADNFKDIKDAYFLQLVFSINHYIEKIFDHISDDYKQKSFQYLYELSVDPEFIKELVKTEKHLDLLDIFTNSDLSDTEATACLIAIVHLFQKCYINEISETFLNKIIHLCLEKEAEIELNKYVLSVLHKILCNRHPNFSKWKEEILENVTVDMLMYYIMRKEAQDLQFGALLVINTMIKCCRGDKKQQLIKGMLKQRNVIHRFIIQTNNIDKSMSRELFTFQTHILSQYADILNSVIAVNDPQFFESNEFEDIDVEAKKMTLLMDFDESEINTKYNSIEDLLEMTQTRISLASMSSKFSEEDPSRLSNRILSSATNDGELDTTKISLLTVEALRHYKTYHPKTFYQSKIEENYYEPGILITSERVIRMLAKILYIGVEPDRNCICYQPLIFTCAPKSNFLFELFSRTMWLLSKTRREMKASIIQDYEKVIRVLSKQVRLVLEEKPEDFKKLTKIMMDINYEKVASIWQIEKERGMKNVIETNPSVQVLKQNYKTENEKHVFEQRMNYVFNGTVFPKFTEKKITGNFKAKLATNGRELLICDYDVPTRQSGKTVSHPVDSITHIVEGKACPHVINQSVKEPYLAFSIVLDNRTYINFKAPDKKTVAYWVDAFNLLLEKEKRSQYFKDELEELVKMDLYLHLMELQNVKIPTKPPSIPISPLELRPPIPPKPHIYDRNSSKYQKQ